MEIVITLPANNPPGLFELLDVEDFAKTKWGDTVKVELLEVHQSMRDLRERQERDKG